ncbi:hypothetical protein J6590_045619 [Homalodisca vitripennis]|nr:hypothetical protein J6590_045619 [Homalodisca vitripennis]
MPSIACSMTDKIIFLNSQGFQNKKDPIKKFIKTNKPLAFLVAEHFQRNQNLLKGIDGYTARTSYCRDKNRERGGVANLLSNDLDYKLREDLDEFCEKRVFEVTNIEIPSRNLVVSTVYRPPRRKKLKEFWRKMDLRQ